jgi:hypothetical protein
MASAVTDPTRPPGIIPGNGRKEPHAKMATDTLRDLADGVLRVL